MEINERTNFVEHDRLTTIKVSSALLGGKNYREVQVFGNVIQTGSDGEDVFSLGPPGLVEVVALGPSFGHRRGLRISSSTDCWTCVPDVFDGGRKVLRKVMTRLCGEDVFVTEEVLDPGPDVVDVGGCGEVDALLILIDPCVREAGGEGERGKPM